MGCAEEVITMKERKSNGNSLFMDESFILLISKFIKNEAIGRCEPYIKILKMNIIKLHKGDITKLEVDAIVNAANKTLLGGGGVDGAIHRAAGKELLGECRALNGCNTGEAKITKGYNLPAKYVIHTVGPVYHGGKYNEAEKLASCYRNSLRLAVENGIKSVAFPNISTGVYGYPKMEAARIAIREVTVFLKSNKEINQVIFCVFDDENYRIYEDILEL
jgi:O-acetyl-ADP-ribose deacetylase (regulator of RNase III)